MVGKQTVDWQQCALLIMLFTIGTSILVIPTSLAAIAKQDAWMAAMLGTGIGVIIVWLYGQIGKTFPAMNLAEINESVFGKWIGKAVSLGFAFFCLHTSAQVLYYVGNFLTTEIMAETPIEVIHILFMAIVVFGVRLGLETLARAAEIFMPWVIVLYVIFLLSISPQSQLKNLKPLFEVGVRPILLATLDYLSYSCLPLVVMLMFFPKEMNSPKRLTKSFSIGYIAGSAVMIILTAVTLLVLGPDLSARLSYSVYGLAKGINVGNFLQRIEAIIAGIWFITIFFKLTFYFFACVSCISQTFQLKSYHPIVYPLGVMVVALATYIYPNVAYMSFWDVQIWIPYTLSIGLFYPLLLLGIFKFKQYVYPKKTFNK